MLGEYRSLEEPTQCIMTEDFRPYALPMLFCPVRNGLKGVLCLWNHANGPFVRDHPLSSPMTGYLAEAANALILVLGLGQIDPLNF